MRIVLIAAVLFCLYCQHIFAWQLPLSLKKNVNAKARFSGNHGSNFKKVAIPMKMMQELTGLDDYTRERIDSVLSKNKVVLFMKGTKLFPQCGFSNNAVRILDALNVPFETVNVLDDEQMRAGIKIYSNWPTIPQLYVNKEFIGGSDIMIQLYNSGELAEMIEIANAG